MAPRNNREAPVTEVRSPAKSFAQTLDTFYGAAARDTRGEQAKARGTAMFGAILNDQAENIKDTRNKGEFTQGTQDALREQAGEELQGVKTGNIFRQNSTFYMMGLNETRGKAAASKFKNDLTLAYQDWDGRHIDDDGSAFRDWMNGQVAEFMGGLGENQHKVAGALPTVNEIAANFASQHTAFTAQRLETEAYEAYDEIVSGVLRDKSSGDLTEEEAIERLVGEADDMYLTEGAAANDRVVEATIRFAHINDDPDAMLLLATAHDQGKFKLSQKNREKLRDASDALETKIINKNNRLNKKDADELKEKNNAVLSEYAEELSADPYAKLPAFSEVGDPATWSKMRVMSDAMQARDIKVDPKVAAASMFSLKVKLDGLDTYEEKMAALMSHLSTSKAPLTPAQVSAFTKQFKAEDDDTTAFGNPILKSLKSGFVTQIGSAETDQFFTDGSSALSVMAGTYYDEYVLTQGSALDVTDSKAVKQFNEDAKEYARQMLLDKFPVRMGELLQREGQGELIKATGITDTATKKAAEDLERIDAENTGNAAADEANVTQEAGVAVEQEAERQGIIDGAIKGVSDILQGTNSKALPAATAFVDPVEPILEDVEFTEGNTPVETGLYGELIQRFTDGEDTRLNMASATAVMEGDPEFASEVNALGAELGVNPMALMAVMDFESGFSTEIENAAGSGATGLIQFMPRTASSLGTSTAELKRMNRKEQMVYVRKYFKQYGNRLVGGSVDDIYMAVLWPAAIGKPDGHPIFRKGTIAYTQNKGLDTNGDGVVTKYEAASKVARKFYGY